MLYSSKSRVCFGGCYWTHSSGWPAEGPSGLFVNVNNNTAAWAGNICGLSLELGSILSEVKKAHKNMRWVGHIGNCRNDSPAACGSTLKWTVQLSALIIHTYSLTPWNRVLLEKLTGSQQVKKFPAFYGTRRFITAFASTATSPYLEPDQSSPYPHIPLPEYYPPI